MVNSLTPQTCNSVKGLVKKYCKMQCLSEKIPTIWRILCNQKAWFDVLWIFSVMKLIWVAVHRLACILHIYIARDSGQTTQISVTLFINELVSSYVPCTYHAAAILNIANICQAEYWGKPNTLQFLVSKECGKTKLN